MSGPAWCLGCDEWNCLRSCAPPPRFHATLTEPPVRLCCNERHDGPVCPDGLVMCCICFKRVPTDRLHVLEDGPGTDASSAPVLEDVCRTCKQREQRWGGGQR